MSAVAEKKRSVTIHPQRMKLAEYDRQDWTVTAELGHTIEDVQQPDYWAHMAEQMKPYDHVEVRVDDGAWVAYLLVTACGKNWARVQLLSKYDLVEDSNVPTSSAKHKVEWKGPHFKFCVVRISDGEKVKEQCTSRAEATTWMTEHERTVG